MTKLDLARFQFASTSIYHFFFVPVTIGLAFLVALLQTAWHRRRDEAYLRLTRFFGTLLVINIAIGVVTGLVQEFQFGMDWSAYSRFVGDVFGAPLAMEGLAPFFLESTFLGLWIFGWGRLPRRVHLATIWAVAAGAALSAAFIMAANSWMQHPVGYTINQAGRAQLTNIWAVLTNPEFVWAYAHVLLAALVTGSVVMLAVSAWHLKRDSDTQVFHKTAALALIVLVPASLFAMMVGSHLGVIETKFQPMKVAAMEAQWNTCQPCSFSAFQIGGGKQDKTPTKIIAIPHLLSLLADDSWNGKVVGMNQLNAQYQQKYGPGNYVPNVFIQYWSMRVMAYIAVVVFVLALWGMWLLWRRKLAATRWSSTWFLKIAVWAAVLPFLMNTAGWMLTENGRQPWIVQGLQQTKQGVSPSISTATVAISLTVFVLLYGVLAVVDWALMVRYSRKQLDPVPELNDLGEPVAAMSY
jgi:cytochrome bd ubiquinol oxidase subunit I